MKSNLDKFELKDIHLPDNFTGQIIINSEKESITYNVKDSLLENITYMSLSDIENLENQRNFLGVSNYSQKSDSILDGLGIKCSG